MVRETVAVETRAWRATSVIRMRHIVHAGCESGVRDRFRSRLYCDYADVTMRSVFESCNRADDGRFVYRFQGNIHENAFAKDFAERAGDDGCDLRALDGRGTCEPRRHADSTSSTSSDPAGSVMVSGAVARIALGSRSYADAEGGSARRTTGRVRVEPHGAGGRPIRSGLAGSRDQRVREAWNLCGAFDTDAGPTGMADPEIS